VLDTTAAVRTRIVLVLVLVKVMSSKSLFYHYNAPVLCSGRLRRRDWTSATDWMRIAPFTLELSPAVKTNSPRNCACADRQEHENQPQTRHAIVPRMMSKKLKINLNSEKYLMLGVKTN